MWFDRLKSLINLVVPQRSRAGETPSTLAAELANKNLNRPLVFDPALCPLNAQRAAEPRFESDEDAGHWNRLRVRVMHHLLETISKSPCGQNLVLRGSTVLAAWFGDQARSPRDLDWVVTPDSMKFKSSSANSLIQSLLSVLMGSRITDELSIPSEGFAAEEIWTYEKSPGQRIVIPWACRDVRFNGTVQLDLAFEEAMFSPPVETELRFAGLPPIRMTTSSREQSLAWKLLWLMTDTFPEGKDLFDAVLLAETTKVPLSIVQKTFEQASYSSGDLTRAQILDLDTEWDDFLLEYPKTTGTAAEWQQRLANALEPLWKELEGQAASRQS
jgi:predicted nucleotidyltransferase component of viral defense system